MRKASRVHVVKPVVKKEPEKPVKREWTVRWWSNSGESVYQCNTEDEAKNKCLSIAISNGYFTGVYPEATDSKGRTFVVTGNSSYPTWAWINQTI